jgi:hypothetical protein
MRFRQSSAAGVNVRNQLVILGYCLGMRPVEGWANCSAMAMFAAASAMLYRLLHHGQVLKCGRRSWRIKAASPSGGQ